MKAQSDKRHEDALVELYATASAAHFKDCHGCGGGAHKAGLLAVFASAASHVAPKSETSPTTAGRQVDVVKAFADKMTASVASTTRQNASIETEFQAWMAEQKVSGYHLALAAWLESRHRCQLAASTPSATQRSVQLVTDAEIVQAYAEGSAAHFKECHGCGGGAHVAGLREVMRRADGTTQS